MRTAMLLIGSLGLLAGCTVTPRQQPQQASSPAPSPTAAPQGQSCIDIVRISEARVRDDRTIDFMMRDGTVYRNVLPNACPQLGFEKAFTYATSLSRLCSTDIITVIVQGGGPRTGASCGLGTFVPAPPEAPASSR